MAKKPPECSVREGKYTLCASMTKYLVSNSRSSPRAKGLFDMDNLMNFEKGTTRSMGPVYRPGKGDPGVLFNFCPWCGSDIDKNWRTPEKERVGE